ncbi:MAG: methionine aminopeptidase [Phycisphaerae bacterium]
MTGLKTQEQVEAMRRSGRLVFTVLRKMHELARPGISTAELNEVAEKMIRDAGAQALFRGVRNKQAKFPFPAALCTSVNEQVVHGIPSDRPLVEGDVVSVDCGVRLGGFCGDSATTIAIGQISDDAQRLLSVTLEALAIAVERIRPKVWWSDVAAAIQSHVESAGFSVVREFVGHGIGRDMHEEPKVPNYVDPKDRKQDFLLRPGMTLAVEPMVNMGSPEVEYGDSTGWPVVTKDRRYAAHFEHTIAVTARGADVLTDGR